MDPSCVLHPPHVEEALKVLRAEQNKNARLRKLRFETNRDLEQRLRTHVEELQQAECLLDTLNITVCELEKTAVSDKVNHVAQLQEISNQITILTTDCELAGVEPPPVIYKLHEAIREYSTSCENSLPPVDMMPPAGFGSPVAPLPIIM
eukprot:TRINITY_DN9975_c0_g1_i2.p1 TRINITY_DN9975_c0_g1~~TRINITY_DN9975_c0_g1_i2.p1  ORF type:complete len:149 (+),score=30.65 TRINITY_DN9975_c0_g1_i2:110-556(+)